LLYDGDSLIYTGRRFWRRDGCLFVKDGIPMVWEMDGRMELCCCGNGFNESMSQACHQICLLHKVRVTVTVTLWTMRRSHDTRELMASEAVG
jgi:hypothetical protein